MIHPFKSVLFLSFSTVLLFSCGTCKKKNSEEKIVAEQKVISSIENETMIYSSYFEARGSEPFWNFQLTEEKLILSQLDKATITLKVGQNESKKVGERSYSISDLNFDYLVSIEQKQCMNTSSGEMSNYTVSFTTKDKTGKLVDKLIGCGDYKVDKRLHDIWVLEELNGEKVSSSEFPREFPRMEIQAADQSFSGFTGCNQMFGKINVENGMFQFQNVGTTKMLCDGVSEITFLKTMELVTHYQLKNLKLILYTSTGKMLIFKKVD